MGHFLACLKAFLFPDFLLPTLVSMQLLSVSTHANGSYFSAKIVHGWLSIAPKAINRLQTRRLREEGIVGRVNSLAAGSEPKTEAEGRH